MNITKFEEFIQWTHRKNIKLESWKNSIFVIVCRNWTELDLQFTTVWENTTVEWYILCLATESHKLKCFINAHLKHNNCSANLHIVTLYWNWWNAHIDWGVTIHPDIVKAEGHLLEENIIVWKWVIIKTLPMLDVRSSDVKASHGAKIEQLDKVKQFYLESKGLPKDEAQRLMIGWYIESLLSPLSDEEKIKSLKEDYLTSIL